ncbi:MAG: Uracil DNA glycosylase superfamily protein [Chloroflexi bacterium ADurb.Bin360]|nr:MAG: Uracil DNA glycosylase superfamily protein [Chloroflexi bacterium ADurb.Bin360]
MDTWDTLTAEIIGCRACPRLVTWRENVACTKRRAYREWDYWGRPVSGFGDQNARIVIVGLAPGAHGSNRTGRMFTGDSSGQTLYGALYRAGFANQPTWERTDDGLVLQNVFITAVGRCAPPDNKPTHEELLTCRPFLERELALLPVQTVLALGKIAFDGLLALWRDQGHAIPALPFAHGARYDLGGGLPQLRASYHPSRQNTQTGRLTLEMFDAVFASLS